MRHIESETTQQVGEHTYSWPMTVDKSFTKLINLAERKAIINWLTENGATPSDTPDGPRYAKLGERTEIWKISENEPLFIHTRVYPRTQKRTIRLDASTATAGEMIEDKIIKVKTTK